MGMHFHVVLPSVFYVCFVAKDSPLQTEIPEDGNLTISATRRISLFMFPLRLCGSTLEPLLLQSENAG